MNVGTHMHDHGLGAGGCVENLTEPEAESLWVAESDETYGPGGCHGGTAVHYAVLISLPPRQYSLSLASSRAQAFVGNLAALQDLPPESLATADRHGRAPSHHAAEKDHLGLLKHLNATAPATLEVCARRHFPVRRKEP